MRHILRTLGLVAIGLASIAAQSHADSFSQANIATNTTDFGYLSAASNSDALLIDLNGGGENINGAVFTGGGTSGTVGAVS